MSCFNRLIHQYYPTLFEAEEERIKDLSNALEEAQGVIKAKHRMGDFLENEMKLQKAHYDHLSSKYQNALSKLSQYIEKYGAIQGCQTQAKDDGKIVGNPKKSEGKKEAETS